MKRCKYLNESKYPPPETKKKRQGGKYMETKKRITKLRRLLDQLQEDFKESKRVSKMCKQLDELELEAKDEISTLIYDRGSTSDPISGTMMDLKRAAFIAIGYFNKTCSVKYVVLEVMRATKYMCSGHVLCLTFIAKPYGIGEEPQSFKAEIYYGTGVTEVNSVQMLVDT
ncbi:hypothetical protein CASFOL_038444 [Castilleja foliolosa]|uniref:Uncharacterized protein n=1 Tax=Castilleja foliolosa TaxID=1961234 RepID=A0ABD3BLP5_9LAMI